MRVVHDMEVAFAWHGTHKQQKLCDVRVVLIPHSACIVVTRRSEKEYVCVSCQVILDAIIHASESVRVDCLEMVCTNARTSEPPGTLELKVCVSHTCMHTHTLARSRVHECIHTCVVRMPSSLAHF